MAPFLPCYRCVGLAALLACLAPTASWGGPPEDAPLRAPASHLAASTSSPRHTEEDTARSADWVAHGAFALVPLSTVVVASVAGKERLWATTLEATAGTLVASLPGSLLFIEPTESSQGRVGELDTAAFVAGIVLTPPLAALGTWGLGELAFGVRLPGQAFIGALTGALIGTFAAVTVHAVLEGIVGGRPALAGARRFIGYALIGSSATLGYQWAGGGPRP